MTKTKAKRIVCGAFATHMDNGGFNNFLREGQDGEELPEADQARMKEAFDELCDELRRRSAGARR